jgi:UDP-N-acetylglucosamine 2-epimerase (non-hydrolysing)
MKVLIPFGTRPEAIKLAPVVRALEARGCELRILATGQHFEDTMSTSIWAEVGLTPDESWELPSAQTARMGEIVARALDELAARRPDVVLLLGDTHTVPAFCLAARAHQVPVAHVEAGLRSFNETSLEEGNRRIAATSASIHFAPTVLAAEYLLAEGVAAERIRVVGNPVIDAVVAAGIDPVPPVDREGILVTAHRATNVDDPQRLEQLVTLLLALVERGPVTFPVHPRTRARLGEAGASDRLIAEGIELVEPLPYRRLLERLASSRVVVTDSGGLQEEASWLGVPSVVLRHSTPRWEAVLTGAARLVGLDVERAMDAVRELETEDEQERVAALPCPFGDGHAGERIAAELLDPGTAPLLRVEEHDYVGRTPPGGIEAVLFDLDDTLYSQQEWLDGAWRAIAEVMGSLWEIDREDLYAALCKIADEGSAQGAIIDRALAAVGARNVPISWRVATFRAFKPGTLDPYPGVREALEDLRQRVPIGLVTDGDPELQESKLRALGLHDAFDVVVFSDMLGPLERKPSPEPFRRALAALEVDPGHAVYVGDNPVKDVTGALTAGLLPVRVTTGEYAGVPDGLPPWRRVADAVEAMELLRPLLSTRRRVRVEVDA